MAHSTRRTNAGSRRTGADHAVPRRLFKYLSLDAGSREFTERIFRRNEVWYARASTFNDPFDCNHHIQLDQTAEEWTAQLATFQERFGAGLFGVLGRLFGGIAGELTRPTRRSGAQAPSRSTSARSRTPRRGRGPAHGRDGVVDRRCATWREIAETPGRLH